MRDGKPHRAQRPEDTPTLELDMTVPASVAGITPAVERVLAVAASMDCAADKEFEIETALREALANAMVHGCDSDPRKEVQVQVACTPTGGMVIIVSDPGSGFDPADVPQPDQGEALYSDHGRGIFLIQRLMDEVRIERGGTRIWMRKG